MSTTDPKPPKKSSRRTPAADPAGSAARSKATVATPTTAKRAKPAAESAPAAKRTKAPAAKPAAATTEAPARKRTARKSAAKAVISDQERRHLIEVAAYYIAERGGFANGSPHDHWIEAEREIDAMIAAGFPD
jgi:hypothetical protein